MHFWFLFLIRQFEKPIKAINNNLIIYLFETASIFHKKYVFESQILFWSNLVDSFLLEISSFCFCWSKHPINIKIIPPKNNKTIVIIKCIWPLVKINIFVASLAFQRLGKLITEKIPTVSRTVKWEFLAFPIFWMQMSSKRQRFEKTSFEKIVLSQPIVAWVAFEQ